MSLFKRKNKKDVIQYDRCQYCAEINHSTSWFDSKEEMLGYIKEYSKNNTIYALSMFRFDIYNLIK